MQNYPQLYSGQNTEWSNQLNEPGHPSSSQGPWNQPFDSNEQYPSSHVHWPNYSSYDPYNQHNTSIQQDRTWNWINNPSSSTHGEHFGGNYNN